MESVRDLLADPLKGTRQAQDILCYLFREVLLWRKINQRIWNRKQEIFFEKPHNHDFQDRGNLNKLLKADTMQWTAFKRAMDFLDPVRCTFEIRLTWKDLTESSYLVKVDPTEPDDKLTVNSFPDESGIFQGNKPSKTLVAHLLRHILAVESAKQSKDPREWWNDLFTQYESNPINTVGLTQKEINSKISSLRRALTDERLSWNNLRRGIYLLSPIKEQYILTLHWTDNPKLKVASPDSIHEITIVDPYLNKGVKQ